VGGSPCIRWLDHEGAIVEHTETFGPALRLFGVDRFRQGQSPIILAALLLFGMQN